MCRFRYEKPPSPAPPLHLWWLYESSWFYCFLFLFWYDGRREKPPTRYLSNVPSTTPHTRLLIQAMAAPPPPMSLMQSLHKIYSRRCAYGIYSLTARRVLTSESTQQHQHIKFAHHPAWQKKNIHCGLGAKIKKKGKIRILKGNMQIRTRIHWFLLLCRFSPPRRAVVSYNFSDPM